MFILHAGYFWLPTGLLLLGAGLVGVGAIPVSAAIHALIAGAMGTMILAVTTRATLGHTGRNLAADPATVLIYTLVTAGAVLRVAAPLGLIDYVMAMRLSALAGAALSSASSSSTGRYCLRRGRTKPDFPLDALCPVRRVLCRSPGSSAGQGGEAGRI